MTIRGYERFSAHAPTEAFMASRVGLRRVTTSEASDLPALVAEAAQALRDGRLVVFPTETVYGLGANALDPDAVREIFAAKRRPADNPLIVHVANAKAARSLVRAWPAEAQKLADAFWPGPLTLVLPRDASVPDITTGGLDTVAVRVPAHPVALALLREARVPVAAPSANVSGRPSPTRVTDAQADLGDAVAVYIDGGPTNIGIESTVIGLVDGQWMLFRAGGTSVEGVEQVLGAPLALVAASETRALSPGMKYRHYAPRARVMLVEGGADEMARAFERESAAAGRVAIIASREHAPTGPHVRVPGSRDDGAAWGASLFAMLRDLDAEGYDVILVECIPDVGLGRAVMERLRKAAA